MAETDAWDHFPDVPKPPTAWDQFPDAANPQSRVGAFAQPVAGGGTGGPSAADQVLEKARGVRSGTLASKITNLVKGQHDPAYAGIKSFNEEMDAENNQNAIGKMGLGSFVTADDTAFGDIMKNSIGDRFIRKEKDAHGYDVIVYRGPDGAERKAYVNKPGLDAEDVTRGLAGTVPYVAGGVGSALATKGMPLLARMAGQFVGGAGTSMASDIAAGPLGSEQAPDVGRAAVMGGLGATGEALSVPIAALWRKLVTVPGVFDASAGQLTPKGVNLAIEAGLDPKTFTREMAENFAKEYAITGEAAAAGRQFASHDLGIESSLGQRTKDPAQLLEEGAMWRGLRGDAAKQEMQDFYARQKAQVRNAALGNPEEAGAGNIPGRLGIGAGLNPAREVKDLTVPELGASIQEGLQTAQRAARGVEEQAWKGLNNITATPEAIDLLPQYIGPVLNAREVDPAVTPMAYRMADALKRYVTAEPGEAAFSALGQSVERPTVDGMRRKLGQMVGDAAPGSDKSAAREIYESYNTWIGEAADRQLLAGHPDAAAALRNAREISRDIKDIFQPRDARSGQPTPAKSIIEKVMQKADSPESVVRSLVGRPDSEIRMGAVDALNRMKKALEKFGGPEGQHVWNDMRSAYYMKMITDAKGELLSPQMMLNTFKKTFEKQPTVLNALYTPAERAEMKKLVKSLEEITYKDPNPSGSGYAIASFAKGFLGTLMDAIPFGHKITVPVRALYHITGMPEAAGRAAAQSAVSQAMRRGRPPSMGAPTTAGGQAYRPEDEDQQRP